MLLASSQNSPIPAPTARYDPTLSGELKPLQAAQMEELPWEGAARMRVDGSMEGDMNPHSNGE